MVREFTLINSKNESWEFNNKLTKVFLNEPQGLGFKRTETATRYGNRQIFTEITDDFPEFQGEIMFFQKVNDDRYVEYDQFCRFISYEPLKLVYSVPGVNNFTLDCIVESLTKTESEPSGYMRCPIVIKGLGFWKGIEETITGSTDTYTIHNLGDYPVGCEITVEGSLTNPDITFEQNSELYGEAKFIDSTAFDSVYVNSNDGEQNVILEQGGSVLPNPISYRDLSINNGSIYVTFVKLARGESDLTIGMDSGSITSVEIKFTPIYRSV